MKPQQKRQRRAKGSAWYWKQTDTWYFTPPGTRRRVPLLDDQGRRIRGSGNRQAAELALARHKVAGTWRPSAEVTDNGTVATLHAGDMHLCASGGSHALRNPSEEDLEIIMLILNEKARRHTLRRDGFALLKRTGINGIICVWKWNRRTTEGPTSRRCYAC